MPPARRRANNTARLEEAVRRIMNMRNLNNTNRAQLNQTLRMLETRENRNRNLVATARRALRAHNNYNSNNNVQPMRGLNLRPNLTKNKAATKIQAALRGWLARSKHLPKNKFSLVIGPNGIPMIAVRPTRLGASVAKKAADMKQYNRYMSRLRGM
jgi:IQ calmodulin-binding motif